MNNEKIIDRIRKLLAMSKDTASPNEAAIAARRARKMMDDYQVSEMDLTSTKESDLGESIYETGITCVNKPLSILSVAVGKFNDCQVRYERIGRFLNIRFEGMLVDGVCAIELMKYLRDEMYRQSERNAKGRGNRHAYRLGFASGVADQVGKAMQEREQIKTSNGTALVACKQQLVRQHFGAVKYSQKQTAYSGSAFAFSQGSAAGQEANLGRQVTGTSQKRIAS